jgi:hypothetical protein
MLRRVVWKKFTDVSEVLVASNRPDDEVAETFETSVYVLQTTWHNFVEDGHLHTRHRENL